MTATVTVFKPRPGKRLKTTYDKLSKRELIAHLNRVIKLRKARKAKDT